MSWRTRVATGVTVAGLVTGMAAAGSGPARASAGSGGGVRPNAAGELDCNGFSRIQQSVKMTLLCADPRGPHDSRFYDNGWYIGHDEPAIRFVSDRPGSADDITFVERLPLEPPGRPTVSHPGSDITHWFELTPAPWFSLTVCDPQSTPLLPCTPESDANAPHGRYPGAGAGFVELQFYPPGFAPLVDGISCDDTHWCSALNIDSLECTQTGTCNNNCIEPVNFAFIQTDGVPTGPPSPQLSDLATFSPNGHTLLMSPGDLIRVHLFDAVIHGGRALEAFEQDLTSGASGYMVASAANGFMNTDVTDCSGRPFNFQPEYSSAAAPDLLPWGIGPYEVDTEFEIGHFEPCTYVTGPRTLTIGSFHDVYYSHCHGPYESAADTSGSVEPDDTPCFPYGDTHDGQAAPDLVTGCGVFFDAIGDLDYDGTPYWADWPNSVRPDAFPGSFLQDQPTGGGAGYPEIQFETDNSATQHGCDITTGRGCVLPPHGPGHFYPYWTFGSVDGRCYWEFGDMSNGRSFGRDGQYGTVHPGSLGAFIGPVMANPAAC